LQDKFCKSCHTTLWPAIPTQGW